MQILKNGNRIDTPEKAAETMPAGKCIKRTVTTGSEGAGRVQSLAPVQETSGYGSIEEYRERNH